MASVALKEIESLAPESTPALNTIESISTGRRFSLKRSGGRPVQFSGELVAEAIGHSTEGRLWHEINIYSVSSGGFAVELRVFKKEAGSKDIFYAAQADSIDQVIDWIESYDATQDIISTVDIDNPGLSAYDLTMQAVGYRLRADEAQRAYANLSGELLSQIGR